MPLVCDSGAGVGSIRERVYLLKLVVGWPVGIPPHSPTFKVHKAIFGSQTLCQDCYSDSLMGRLVIRIVCH